MSIIILNISDLNVENATIAFVGMGIVFLALTILYFFFKIIPKIVEWQIKARVEDKETLKGQTVEQLQLPAGVDAAISAALYLYLNEIHDEENSILTIKKVSKAYSPWSSKIYNMRWPLR
jgi:glutaconyl-CoA/methylmalonyl-CoA decarboxylase subunit delta